MNRRPLRYPCVRVRMATFLVEKKAIILPAELALAKGRLQKTLFCIRARLNRLRKNTFNVWHGFSRAIRSRSVGGLKCLRENRRVISQNW
jgi:hypothetical protein